jgi:hypothetical protein
MGRVSLLVVLAVLCVGVASANTAPLPDAGLDQQVDSGTTVYLDAGGSTDPDGTVVDYAWSITGPNGSSVSPACPSCTRTRFVPTRPGEYEATVAVTDDDGATRNDTLYVTVAASNPPTVDVSGPGSILAGDPRTYTAEASAGDASLSTVTWRVDGTHHTHTRVDGESATVTHTFDLPPGNHTVTARVIAADGLRDTARLAVDAADEESVPTGDGGTGDVVRYDAEADEWSVNHELVSRITGAVEVGEARVTMEALNEADGSDEVVDTFESKGIPEARMVRAAAQQKNNFQATGEGTLDIIDNSIGQVEFDGETPGDGDGGGDTGGDGGSGGDTDGSSGDGGHNTDDRNDAATDGVMVGL